ncbi:MAG: thioredoxin domain-containing protein [Allomuricauda sp.]
MMWKQIRFLPITSYIDFFRTLHFNPGFLAFLLLAMGSCKNVGESKPSSQLDGETANRVFEFTNDLVDESSPYLLQHAHNPVDWRPWAPDALDTAQKTDQLIVLSIGYSSCHWCHVMEEESFEDIEVAALMNENFVNIKVDREERPDLDQVYQTALKLVSGNGGWPLNAIMLPDGKPVYLGTYHTKEEWVAVLSKFSSEYKNNPDKIKEYAALLTEGVQDFYELPTSTNGLTDSRLMVESGIAKWSNSWDNTWGGDMGNQKFVGPAKLNMLLDYSVLENDESAKHHIELTLEKVSMGGIYDHIGGGFFRYSTDPYWKTPHFEKMLYDNAQLIQLYAKAYQVMPNPRFKDVVYKTFGFLKDEMRNPNGGYYSAMDADSNGKEGGYYIWEKDDLRSVLQEDYPLFAEYFNIKDGEELQEGGFVPYTTRQGSAFADENDLSVEEFNNKKETWEKALVSHREKRKRPAIDDKIITSWNALLIDGYIQAYRTFDDQVFLTEAQKVFDFLMSHNYYGESLLHSFKEEGSRQEVFLEDYAFMAKSALGLYEVTLKPNYLDVAKRLLNTAMARFADESGMYAYSKSDELITKIINIPDGVLPSANAIMAQLLFKIGHIEYNKKFLQKSDDMLSMTTNGINENIGFYGTWASLMLHKAYPYLEIVVVGENAASVISEIDNYPFSNTLLVGSSTESDLSIFDGRYVEGETFIYVCENKTCKLPVTTIPDFLKQMTSFGHPAF